MNKLIIIFGLSILFSNLALAQLGNLSNKVGKAGAAVAAKELGLDQILKKPAAITTSFEDVNMQGSKMPAEINFKNPQPLSKLPKSPTGGYQLCAGYFELTNKSYCLKAGTFGPSKGDGYMYAPVLGPKEKIVETILRNAESKPSIEQHNIQMLLWAIIARTKFINFSGPIKATAIALLTAKELTELEGGALGLLPGNIMEKAKDKLPPAAQAAFEAENNIRNLVASGQYTYADMERLAIQAGMAPVREDVPAKIWTLHPDGYYIRYIPNGYATTTVQLYVPEDLITNLGGKALSYDAVGDIACPANVGAQRLAQTNETKGEQPATALNVKCK